MARRRYVSTDISVDPRVSDLALEAGPYAALLYTWLIPHADDTRAIPSDPRTIKLQVVPGLDHCDVQTIAEAVDAMLRLGLLVDDCGVLRFPESFYKHQSYIKDDRRKSAQNAAIPRNAPTPAQNAASSSFPVSSPVSVSSSEDVNLELGPEAVGAAAPPAAADESLDRVNQTLTGQPGWAATPEQLRKLSGIATSQRLDFELEALKIVDWFESPKGKGRQCSFRFVANWLESGARPPPAYAAGPPATNGIRPRGSSRAKHH